MNGRIATAVRTPHIPSRYGTALERLRPSGEPARAPLAGAPDHAEPADIVDEWGMQSFPASDPPANW